MRKKTVLLCFVKPMNFVNEQQSTLSILPPYFSGFKYFAKVWHTCENRTDLDEMQIRLVGQKPRDRCFANTRRPPENDR